MVIGRLRGRVFGLLLVTAVEFIAADSGGWIRWGTDPAFARVLFGPRTLERMRSRAGLRETAFTWDFGVVSVAPWSHGVSPAPWALPLGLRLDVWKFAHAALAGVLPSASSHVPAATRASAPRGCWCCCGGFVASPPFTQLC